MGLLRSEVSTNAVVGNCEVFGGQELQHSGFGVQSSATAVCAASDSPMDQWSGTTSGFSYPKSAPA